MKKLSFLTVLCFLLLLCACGQQSSDSDQSQTTDTPATADTQTEEQDAGTPLTTAHYTLTIPSSCTTQEQAEDNLDLLYQGEVIGGVKVIPYENAALPRQNLDAMSEEGLDTLLAQITGTTASVDHMFGSYGTDGIQLWFTTGEQAENHYLLPAGDQFYDLWLYDREDGLPAESQNLLSESFTLTQ